jgi:putative restriction endonuclease
MDDEHRVRAAALAWLGEVTLGGTEPVSRERLANDFLVDGTRFPLIDRGRGIRKPQGWHGALSITTSAPRSGGARPYADGEGVDGLQRYKLRRDDRGRGENEALRAAMRDQLPLVWFYGLEPGLFQVIAPVYLIGEEPESDQFVLALTEEQRTVRPGSPMEETLRRYLIRETKRRLHQPVFASQVMLAYEGIGNSWTPPTSSRTGPCAGCRSSRTGWRCARSTTPPTTRTSSASGPTTSCRSTTGCWPKSTGRCCCTACKTTMASR